MNPAFITGADQISALGSGLEDLSASLTRGASLAEWVSLDLPGPGELQIPVCQVRSELPLVGPSKVPLDRGSAMALKVVQGAWAHAGLTQHPLQSERVGVYWGAGMAGAYTFDASCQSLYRDQRRIRPTTVVSIMPNAPAAEIALWARAQGPTQTYACACASSAVALGEALRALRLGLVDVAIVGGSEAMLTPGVMAAWHAMRVLIPASEQHPPLCRPFDADRSGFALGEGAAAFILESPAHARQRGGAPMAALTGYGNSTDAVHITNPDSQGQARAMQQALNDAGLKPLDIGYINAHGTATVAGDLAEAASIAAVFEDQAVLVSSTKPMHGHALGAGGALEFLISLTALTSGRLPISVNLHRQDPGCRIHLVREDTVECQGLRHVMSNSFAFGGTNAVLIASLI